MRTKSLLLCTKCGTELKRNYDGLVVIGHVVAIEEPEKYQSSQQADHAVEAYCWSCVASLAKSKLPENCNCSYENDNYKSGRPLRTTHSFVTAPVVYSNDWRLND